MKQNAFVEADITKNCVVYPNDDFQSYKDCDNLFMKNVVSSFDPPTLVPVWLTNTLENVTREMTMKHLGETVTNKSNFPPQALTHLQLTTMTYGMGLNSPTVLFLAQPPTLKHASWLRIPSTRTHQTSTSHFPPRLR